MKGFEVIMGRKVYVTEEQLTKMFKSNIDEMLDGSYLEDPSGEGNIKDLGYEVGVNPLPDGNPVTTDDIAKEKSPRQGYMDRGIIPMRGPMSEKKNITEVSDATRNRTHKVSGQLANTLKANYQNASQQNGGHRVIGSKRIEKLLTGYTDNYASNLVSDMESGKISPEEYQMLGGDKLKRELDRTVKSDQTIDKSFKQSAKDMGATNAFISPHQKTGTGTAHSEKTSQYFG